MSADTKIEWASKTLNPLVGCSKQSTGCFNCYAIRLAWRFQHNPVTRSTYDGVTRKTKGGQIQWTRRINVVESALRQPYLWKTPQRIFVDSMSDFCHPNVPTDFYPKFWAIVRDNLRHDFLILTKRPDRYLNILPDDWGEGYDNVWLGTSIENQAVYYPRLWELVNVPSKVRFLSLEPLLENIDLGLEAFVGTADGKVNWSLRANDAIHWVIVGGESGHNARECQLEWISSVVNQCKRHDVPVFVKQVGTHLSKRLQLSNRKGSVLEDLPINISVRMFPKEEKFTLF